MSSALFNEYIVYADRNMANSSAALAYAPAACGRAAVPPLKAALALTTEHNLARFACLTC
eukprot:6194079-Pleurochrysis_carterae.AAC.4